MAILGFMDSPLLAGYVPSIVLFLAAVLLLAWSRLQVKNDPLEPTLIKSKIPFIGHVIGMISHKTSYYKRICLANPDLPIYTLMLGVQKMYIIVSPQLIQSAMRKKTLTLEILTTEFAERMVGFGPRIMDLMRNPPTDGSESWMSEHHKVYEVLSPGPPLNEMNAHVLNSVANILNEVGPNFETKKFYLWLRDAFTFATTGALFGAQNPIRDSPELNDCLWDYEGGQLGLLVQPFPSLTARKPYQGRAKVMKALRAYFHAGHDQNSDVSMVIKKRVAVNKKWGLPIDDIADHELGMLFVSITNAIPTLFWMIAYVFRDPQLVLNLQAELLSNMEERKTANGQRECIFDITKFATECPLLVATYQEVMRHTNRQLSTRTILEDTYLDYTPTGDSKETARTFLLKKGAQIQMPSSVTNFALETWGPTVNAFDPRRFLPNNERERQQRKAFNPFGGGKHLCPGRHFAYAEILGAVAALVVGYEILTPEGGRLTIPPLNSNLAEAVGKPTEEAQETYAAKIRRRPGWEGVKWGFVSGNGRE